MFIHDLAYLVDDRLNRAEYGRHNRARELIDGIRVLERGRMLFCDDIDVLIFAGGGWPMDNTNRWDLELSKTVWLADSKSTEPPCATKA